MRCSSRRILSESVSGRIAIENRNDRLQNDGSSVEIFIHEVHRAAGEFHSIFQRLALRFESWEGWKQRRVNIQNGLRKGLHEIGREQPHISRQAHQINLVFAQNGDDLTIISFAFQSPRRHDPSGNVRRFGALNTLRAFAIGNHDRDFGVGDAAGGDAIRQGCKIRAASAK